MTKEQITNKPTLSSLTAHLVALAESVEVDPETGEVTGIEELDAAQADFEEKAAAVAIAIRLASAYATGMKEYKLDLEKRQRAAENKISRLKKYLADNMEEAGIKRIDRIEARITLKHTKAVDVVDETMIPDKYKKIKKEVAKDLIRHAIDAGEDVAGAVLIERSGVIIK